MAHTPRTTMVRILLSSLCILLFAACILTACDDDSDTSKRKADEQAQLQAQLDHERALRLSAEQSAREATESRNTWLVGLGAGACALCALAAILGVHVGTRALSRARQEPPHE